jgi:methylenetetrahydrofolate reductase (NADPH)
MTKSSSTPLSVSFEFFPPKTVEMELKLWQVIERLAPLGPRFVSVTYGAGGSTRERTHSMVRRIRRETALEPAAHLTCVGASRDEIDDIVRDYWATGIRHLVALRGDAPTETGAYVPHPHGYAYAADLVDGIRRIADFEISVAAYPETHPQATNASADIDNLKRKIDAGATRAITQYFFDAEIFLSFRERAAKAGITVPIVPGIMPVTNFAQMARFSAGCGATVPKWLARTFEGLDQDPETRRMVATSVAVDLVRKLQTEGVVDFHFYTSNRAELPVAICHMLGIRAPLPAPALAV